MTREHDRSGKFYVGLTLAISATAFIGFTFTYFSPMAAGAYPAVSPAIHVHGWSFFLWYILLPLQAILMAAGYPRLHYTLGGASLLLATIMTITGLLVASVRIEHALTAGDALGALWEKFGLVITSTLLLFVGFYIAAIVNRRRPDVHKRFMIMASASALGAATFRIIVASGGYYWLATPAWVMPTAILIPNMFIVAGILYDLSNRRSVHPAYSVGLSVAVAVETVGLWLLDNSAGDVCRRLLAAAGHAFGFLY